MPFPPHCLGCAPISHHVHAPLGLATQMALFAAAVVIAAAVIADLAAALLRTVVIAADVIADLAAL